MNPRIEIDGDLRTRSGVIVPASAMVWSFTRSSGAGGQHVNKTSSRATLAVPTRELRGPVHLVDRVRAELGDSITVSNQESRSQWRNRQACREQLALLVDRAAAPPPPTRRKSKPTRGSVERRLAGKKLDSAKKAGRRRENW
ncbi:MAG: alternative ribosome rescue aminoacyl-tRNA hydrolase ArfB [Ilumatobacteraceae bacterium]